MFSGKKSPVDGLIDCLHHGINGLCWPAFTGVVYLFGEEAVLESFRFCLRFGAYVFDLRWFMLLHFTSAYEERVTFSV